MLADACAAAGVALGAYDRSILAWLAGYEPQMCAVVAGIISRARPPRIDGSIPAGRVSISADDLRTVPDALDVAADYKRDRAAGCPDCDTDPSDLCGTCEDRLMLAAEYDALRERIGGQS